MRTVWLLRSAIAAMAIALSATVPAVAAPLTVDDGWYTFDVDGSTSTSFGLEWIDLDGNPLIYEFDVVGTALLRIVDAGFGGDEFELQLNGAQLFTSVAANTFPTSIGLDFDGAFADHANYSWKALHLTSGHYALTGQLSASALDDTGLPLNATVGGVNVTSVSEPVLGLSFLGVVALLALRTRRLA